MVSIKKYGWIPDFPDHRDRVYSVPERLTLPPSVNLTDQMPPVYNQKNLGSCTAQTIAAVLEFLQNKERLRWRFRPSRLFIYYNERDLEGTTSWDSGAMIRDGIKSVNSQGVCPENSGHGWSWPYSDDPVLFRVRPWPACYSDALLHKSLQYESVPQTEQGLKSVLASGFPVVIGITVFDSFESNQATKTGDISMPGKNESVLGGHAVVLVGYRDSDQRFLFRNSWSSGWGNQGYGSLPYDYVLDSNLADDFWDIRLTK